MPKLAHCITPPLSSWAHEIAAALHIISEKDVHAWPFIGYFEQIVNGLLLSCKVGSLPIDLFTFIFPISSLQLAHQFSFSLLLECHIKRSSIEVPLRATWVQGTMRASGFDPIPIQAVTPEPVESCPASVDFGAQISECGGFPTAITSFGSGSTPVNNFSCSSIKRGCELSFPAGKYLVAGVVDGRNIRANDFASSLSTLAGLEAIVGKGRIDKLVVSTSCTRLSTLSTRQIKLDSEIKGLLLWLKSYQVNALAKVLAGEKDEIGSRTVVYGVGVCAEFGSSLVHPLVGEVLLISLNNVIAHSDALQSDNVMTYDNIVSVLGKICQFHRDGSDAAKGEVVGSGLGGAEGGGGWRQHHVI
ncbi:hypothetical protein ZIOFF_050915 [Zingiber officinale]|uniref:Uncharacterized protein n=1 Tax=Zingiber officinale TaxID=94328 RepID=A0A8J5G1D5_ZINOF|nr:hypothetical protein ZIOFF_050915 [Zingiber officinale]